MTSNISIIKQTDALVEKTINAQIIWNNVEILKTYLRKNDRSLSTYQILHEYLVFLQKDKFIFDCSATYFSLYENTLYAFAKGKYSSTYRLDCVNFEEGILEWKSYKIPIILLLRIRNAIELLSPKTTDAMCDRFFSIISSDSCD